MSKILNLLHELNDKDDCKKKKCDSKCESGKSNCECCYYSKTYNSIFWNPPNPPSVLNLVVKCGLCYRKGTIVTISDG